MIPKIATVKTWGETLLSDSSLTTALDLAFTAVNYFEDIWVPLKTATRDGQPDEYTYMRVGYSPGDVEAIYRAFYGANYLVDDFSVPQVASNLLARRIQATFWANRYKYLKNIELLGYEWNPMWNVDGTEKETYTGKDTDTISEKYGKGTTMTSTGSTSDTIDETYSKGTTLTSTGSTSDTINESYGKGTTMNGTTSNDTTVSDHANDTQTTKHTGQTSDYTDTTSFDFHGAVVDPSNPSTGEEGSRKYIPQNRNISDRSKETETVTNSKSGGSDTMVTGTSSETWSGSDTKKGTNTGTSTNSDVWSGNDSKKGANSGTQNRSDVWSGEDSKSGTNSSDKNYTLTRDRHGNIGVTKTTELINSARETLKWSILLEFFNDINEQILVGIY